MRKLVTIRIIQELKPIPGADRIEVAKIDGWNVVVKKDEFKVGDLCLYCEIDSFLPVKPEYDFLLKGSKPKKMLVDGKEVEGIRLKSIRLKGQHNSINTEFKKGCIPNRIPIYECWLKKFGKEEADRRFQIFREKQQAKSTGKAYKKFYGRHEHRVVMEQKLGRSLQKGEIVHHINGNKLDNRPENLIVITKLLHAKIHNTKHKKCTIKNCNLKHNSKGYCHRHYRQMRRLGRIIN